MSYNYGPARGAPSADGKEVFDSIRDVYADNLEQEMRDIMKIVEDYPFVAIDTEFPGVVAKPVCSYQQPEYKYRTVKCNVDVLNIIQLGISFYDANGNRKPGVCTWQFNFKFDLDNEIHAKDSIDLLKRSGINFKAHAERGIDANKFGALLIASGLVLTEEVCWISFHGSYDYAYLVKVLMGGQHDNSGNYDQDLESLPKSEADFFELYKLFFPNSFDLKYIMRSCVGLMGGLEQLASDLKVKRIGPQHQAGSDSLLTAAAFFAMRDDFFEGEFNEEKFMGVLYGLGEGTPRSAPPGVYGYRLKSS